MKKYLSFATKHEILEKPRNWNLGSKNLEFRKIIKKIKKPGFLNKITKNLGFKQLLDVK